MKFVLAFSTGKDSILALHRMIKAGNEPVGLITTFNADSSHSWFHGTDKALLEAIGDSLEIPVILAKTDGTDYNEKFEAALLRGKELGAECCVFGDIDIDEHREWDEKRCSNCGISAVLPLWNENREKLVSETVAAGYKCLIKCVSREKLPESFLGKIIDMPLLEEMRAFGIDLCGENGEYHTVVLGGPIFKKPIKYRLGRVLNLEHVSAVEVMLIKECPCTNHCHRHGDCEACRAHHAKSKKLPLPFCDRLEK